LVQDSHSLVTFLQGTPTLDSGRPFFGKLIARTNDSWSGQPFFSNHFSGTTSFLIQASHSLATNKIAVITACLSYFSFESDTHPKRTYFAFKITTYKGVSQM
jgi:hypothetical protein